MGEEDGIIVKKDGEDIHLKDNDADTEYVVKLGEAENEKINIDENFNETIKSRYRDNFTYASFSEGEKQKIDLALLFTWRAVAKLRNSINTNLLIMDEVFDSSLDQNATDYLMNIIYDVAKNNNVFIISHKEHMNEKFTNVLKFVKYKNFSKIQD
jgi:energy-coupling factor transporter ATP-binding protein EcfA2